jgi:hypothetical protein
VDNSRAGWNFSIHERSAGVYDGSATHESGASIHLTGEDPDELLARLIGHTDNLMPDEHAMTLEEAHALWVDQHNRITWVC